MSIISSNQNPIIKEIKSLKQKKAREEKGLFFIEGIRFVEEAIAERADIDKILVSEKLENLRGGKELLSKIEENKYNIYSLSDKLFKDVSDTENPQGVLAVIKYKNIELDEIIDKGKFFVVLDSIQDPGNMGTIIRTADAAGVTGVIISKGSVDLYNPKVLRSTMGAIFHVPVIMSENLKKDIEKLKKRGIRAFVAHLRGAASCFEADMSNGAAILIGNEANGINEELAEMADVMVKIPMPGRAESLNASVAASILIYEAVRQSLS